MKRVLFIIVVIVVLLFGVLNMLNGDDIILPESNKAKQIVLITKMKDGDYWEVILQGARAAEAEMGIDLIYDAPQYEDDIEGQIALMNYYIDKKVDGIVLAASDFEALVKVVNRAEAENIPVVLIDSSVDTKSYLKSFMTDNYEAGRQAGIEAMKHIGPYAKVGIISFVKGSENAMERERGVREILNGHPGVKILDTVYCMSSIEVAETQAMIFQDQEVDAIIALNSIAATGMGRALSRNNPAVGIGFDSTKEEITYVDLGIINSTIIQNPFAMGYLGVKYAALGSKHEDDQFKKDNTIDTFVITKYNMYSKENQKLVFPFVIEKFLE